MDDSCAAAYRFLLSQARLLELRLFATRFLGQPGSAVVDALRGYQNSDGGFGHGLEPDKRCPDSLPIDVETAFQAMVAAGAADAGMVGRACDFLGRVAVAAGAGGAVPLAFPVIESFPRAVHWSDWTYRPGLNPTAGLAGLLHQLAVDHPWVADATGYCWRQLESGVRIQDAHELYEVFVFLEHVPDRERADKHRAALADSLAEAEMFHLDPAAEVYGLTPLQLAPEPGSRSRALFDDAVIEAHLDNLAGRQQPDGGWPISWEPPSEAALLEWRGIVTVQALRTLTAYGRLAAT
ncbi:MAG TPA: hypothetical protein VH520_09855 [Streptosporangiaceae bacterium]